MVDCLSWIGCCPVATSAHQEKDGELNWERQEMELVSSAAWLKGLFWAAADDSSVIISRESPGIKKWSK